MVSLRRAGLGSWVGLLGASLGACADDSGFVQPDAAVADAALSDRGAADVGRDAPPAPMVLVGVVPAHGSFLGGTEVTLRGSNFTEDAVVRFGGNLVQPRFTRWVDRNRIVVQTPAGRPGVVEVTVEAGGRSARLAEAYRYDSFYVDPALGPTTGNARVSLHGLGTGFSSTMQVLFDGVACTQLEVTSPELASCLTPPHPEGRVAVTVARDAMPAVTLDEGYQYADSADGVGGGLSGGALRGSITVTALDAMTGAPVPMAHVFLENDAAATPPRAGLTNARGQVTLSPPGLMAPVTVTASERCHTTTTVQSFDAASATLYLQPLMLPECGMGMPEPMTQRPVYPARLSGELVWDGPSEFGPNPWRNVPEPGANERRVALVYATRPDIFTADPVTGAATMMARVLEAVEPGYGGRGYPFRFQARPASLAVYALAGIENTRTNRFTPYMMGVARSVLGAPRADITDIVVDMNIPLDHVTPVSAEAYTDPMLTTGLPSYFHASAFLDLGGEGVIALPHTTVTGRNGGEYALNGLPAFSGTLADARLIVHARMASGNITGPTPFQDTPAPCSGLVISGIRSPDEAVRVRDWLGIPSLVSPREFGQLPSDRTVRFDIPRNSPDLLIMNLQWEGGGWAHYAPGSVRAIQYPDLSTLQGLRDLPAGDFLGLSLVGVRIPGFAFNRFTYTSIGPGYWTAYAGRGTVVER